MTKTSEELAKMTDKELAAEMRRRGLSVERRPVHVCATCGGPFARHDLPVMKPMGPLEPLGLGPPAHDPPLLDDDGVTWWLVHDLCEAPFRTAA